MRAEVQAETDRQKAELDAKLAEQAQAAEAAMSKARDEAMLGLSDAAAAIVGDVMDAIGTAKADDAAVAEAVKTVAAE
jgi:hypothetical protein